MPTGPSSLDTAPEAKALSELAHQLAQRALQGSLVVFVGAGVSVGAGLPTWTGLIEDLATASALPKETRAAIAHVNLLDQARIVADACAQAGMDLGAVIAERMRRDRYALGHALLGSLPVNELVTTNYDELFEAAADDAGRSASVLPYQPVAPGQRWLLKMHGTVSQPQDIVLTREDYLNYGRTRGALLGIVQALLITRHMLFVGFSLDDENFIRIAHDVRSAVRRPGGQERPKFGTVLTLLEDEGRRRLWERDFSIEPVATTDPDGPDDGDRQAWAAARRLEILLDGVLAESRTELRHLLDPAFEQALDDDERQVKTSLRELAERAAQASPDSPAWEPVRTFLASFE